MFGNFTSSISVILSEFGAFSGGGGETTIIEKVSCFTFIGWFEYWEQPFLQNNYIYVMPDGSRVESEEPRDDLKIHEVSSTAPTTTKLGSSESSISDGANEDYELEWEDIKEDTPP